MNDEMYRVLILDDDYELGELLRDYLQNTTRCFVKYIVSETELWDTIDKEAFDILFLDYKMPDANGLEVLARMGELGYSIPTVMMTGEGSENVAARAIQSGALDYLVKGEYSFSSLPPLIQKAARLQEMQRAMQLYLEQVRYQSMLLDNMRDAVVVWNLDGKINYWNTAAEQLYGVPAGERLHQHVEQAYFPAFDPPVTLEGLNLVGNDQFEHRFILPGGEVKWISAHLTALYGEGNKMQPIGHMNVARDITPRKQEQEALQKSQNFIKRILDTSPNIIYIMNLDRQEIQFVSAEIKNILPYQPDVLNQISFDTFQSMIHPDDRPEIRQYLLALPGMPDGSVMEVEYRFLSQENEWRWLHNRDTVFSRTESGAPAEIIGVIQDVTASKLAEQKLQYRLSSEKLLANISSRFINLTQPDAELEIAAALEMVTGFIQVDAGAVYLVEGNRLETHCLTSANRCSDLKETDTAWLIERLKRSGMTFLKPADCPEPGGVYERSLLQTFGLQSLMIAPLTYKNALLGALALGSARQDWNWNEDAIYIIRTVSEMITNVLVQTQTDQALRKSEARYRAIVEEHQTEMICRFLPDTTLTFVNEAYCQHHQQERSVLVGTSFLDPVLPDEKAEVRNKLADLSTSEPVVIIEQRVRLPDGDVRWQEWVNRAIFDQRNDFIEFQAVGRDVTERKLMEEQIKAAQTHLVQAARLASIGELASGVAHQISNPLTTIIADAQILRHQLDKDHPGWESAEAIVEAGWRTQQVINGLLKFSQPAKAIFELIAINETIRAALHLAEAHIRAYGVQLHVDLADDLPPISGNPRQLTDLWVNLLLLARTSFIDEDDHNIWIKTRRCGVNDLYIEITDDGIAILAEQYDKIFEPQLIPTGTGRGTGIELSICHELVRQNRGRISVSSQDGKTTFRIQFSAEGK